MSDEFAASVAGQDRKNVTDYYITWSNSLDERIKLMYHQIAAFKNANAADQQSIIDASIKNFMIIVKLEMDAVNSAD